MFGRLAQLVERWTENPKVGGSNPLLAIFYALLVERLVLCLFKYFLLLLNSHLVLGKQVSCTGMDNQEKEATLRRYYFKEKNPAAFSGAQKLIVFSKTSIQECFQFLT